MMQIQIKTKLLRLMPRTVSLIRNCYTKSTEITLVNLLKMKTAQEVSMLNTHAVKLKLAASLRRLLKDKVNSKSMELALYFTFNS